MAMSKIVSIRVFSTYESCERTTYYVELTSDEGFTMTPCSHATGSIYTDHAGLSKEEARERALIDAADWGDYLNIEPEPLVEDGVVIEPTFKFQKYTLRREARRERPSDTTPLSARQRFD
jgi:hypothetical protein